MPMNIGINTLKVKFCIYRTLLYHLSKKLHDFTQSIVFVKKQEILKESLFSEVNQIITYYYQNFMQQIPNVS